MSDTPEPCTDLGHGRGRHWHLTLRNRDGCIRYATTRDASQVRTPAGWTFVKWGWDK